MEDNILEKHEFRLAVNDLDKFIRNNQCSSKRQKVSLLANTQLSSEASNNRNWIDKVIK